MLGLSVGHAAPLIGALAWSAVADYGLTQSIDSLRWPTAKKDMPTSQQAGRLNLFAQGSVSSPVALFRAFQDWIKKSNRETRGKGASFDESTDYDNGVSNHTKRNFVNFAAREELTIQLKESSEPSESVVSRVYRKTCKLKADVDATFAAQCRALGASARQIDLAWTFELLHPPEHKCVAKYDVINDGIIALERAGVEDVYICAYDICGGFLSEEAAKGVGYPVLTINDQPLRHLWHVTICAFGNEYQMSDSARVPRVKRVGSAAMHVSELNYRDEPNRATTKGALFQSHNVGQPHMQMSTFNKYIDALCADRFPPNSYDLLTNNCVDFVSDALWFLSRQVMPEEYGKQVEQLKFSCNKHATNVAVYISNLLKSPRAVQFQKMFYVVSYYACELIYQWFERKCVAVASACSNAAKYGVNAYKLGQSEFVAKVTGMGTIVDGTCLQAWQSVTPIKNAIAASAAWGVDVIGSAVSAMRTSKHARHTTDSVRTNGDNDDVMALPTSAWSQPPSSPATPMSVDLTEDALPSPPSPTASDYVASTSLLNKRKRRREQASTSASARPAVVDMADE